MKPRSSSSAVVVPPFRERAKLACAIAVMLVLSTFSLLAQPAGDLFRRQELSLDLFGSVSVGQGIIENLSGERVTDHGRLGAGIGLNYFFTRYLGVGADAYSESLHDTFVDNASGNLIVRFPFEEVHLAPYVFGGGGHQFDPEDRCFGQFGGGLEVRVTPNWGFFVDARYMLLEGDADNFGLARLGVRLAF